jgi:antitoxin MazE
VLTWAPPLQPVFNKKGAFVGDARPRVSLRAEAVLASWSRATYIHCLYAASGRVEILQMRVKFAKWGNSIAVRIPAAFAGEIGATENGAAELSVEGRRLVIAPVDDVQVFDLDVLIAGITDENRHDELHSGPAQGNEFG